MNAKSGILKTAAYSVLSLLPETGESVSVSVFTPQFFGVHVQTVPSPSFASVLRISTWFALSVTSVSTAVCFHQASFSPKPRPPSFTSGFAQRVDHGIRMFSAPNGSSMSPVRVSRSKVRSITIGPPYASPASVTFRTAPGSRMRGASLLASHTMRSFAPSVNDPFVTGSRRMIPAEASSLSRTSDWTANAAPSAVVAATVTVFSGKADTPSTACAYLSRTVWQARSMSTVPFHGRRVARPVTSAASSARQPTAAADAAPFKPFG